MNEKEQAILKNGILLLILVIGIDSLTNFVYSYLSDLLFGEYVNFFLFSTHLLGFLVIRKYSYKELEKLMPFYIIIIMIILFPEMVVSFKKERLTGLLWLIPAVPLGLTIFFPNRNGAIWAILVFLFTFFIFLLHPLFPNLLSASYILPEEQRQMTNLLTIWTAFTCSLVPLYTKLRLTSLKIENTTVRADKEETEKIADKNEIIKEKNVEKLNNLFNEIVKCFEEKKLYRDSDFTVSKLANTLNTNSNYIHQAIKQNKQMNFNAFVNQYRINLIKALIADGWDKKYTIQHIYSSAGYRHQTTFNKVFKSIEGMNPSDYIALQKV